MQLSTENTDGQDSAFCSNFKALRQTLRIRKEHEKVPDSKWSLGSGAMRCNNPASLITTCEKKDLILKMQQHLTHRPPGGRGSSPAPADERVITGTVVCSPVCNPGVKQPSLPLLQLGMTRSWSIGWTRKWCRQLSAQSAEGYALHFPIFPLECGPAGQLSWPLRLR